MSERFKYPQPETPPTASANHDDPYYSGLLERIEYAIVDCLDALNTDDSENEFDRAIALLVALRVEGLNVYIDDPTD